MAVMAVTGSGSSPHTRGARPSLSSRRAPGRIIPAYAGSTSPWSAPSSKVPDHPRIRGEHALMAVMAVTGSGSSPHTRGARPSLSSRRAPGRIIPAYAGSTYVNSTYPALAADHPRIRGEHAKQALNTVYGKGSSPHTRGARRPAISVSRASRIIPAYAGSTDFSPSTSDAAADHPRIRGEHFPEPGLDVGQAGSSPHTRGALRFLGVVGLSSGIIPAYAGSTTAVPRRR